MLTTDSRYGYTESLKTAITAFTPRQSVFFMPFLAWTRAENIQYQPKLLIAAFSESTPLLILNGEFLRKAIKMNLVQISGHKAITTSKVVADTFGKAHKDVIRAINSLEIPRDFWERNFTPSKYRSQNKNGQILPAYEITRDGFTLLAMGFTGKKAIAFKIKYIEAFNEMEAKLKKVYPCGEVNVREHTRSLPSGKKEIVLSEKAKSEIGGIVKNCLAATGKPDIGEYAQKITLTLALAGFYSRHDDLQREADNLRHQLSQCTKAINATLLDIKKLEEALQ